MRTKTQYNTRPKPPNKVWGRSLNIKNKDKALIQHEDKTLYLRSTPQIQVEEQSLILKKRPRSKHWQTECRRQRLKENNRTKRCVIKPYRLKLACTILSALLQGFRNYLATILTKLPQRYSEVKCISISGLSFAVHMSVLSAYCVFILLHCVSLCSVVFL